jgi:tetratricopeptide (TPR) repeat protein
MKRLDPLAKAVEEAGALERLGRRNDAKSVLARALAGGEKRGFFGQPKKAARGAGHVDAARRFAALAAASPGPKDIELLAALAAEYPVDATIRCGYAASLASNGKRVEAVGEYEDWIRANPKDGAALAALAADYAALGRREEALERYGRALDALLSAHLVEAACGAARGIAALSPASIDDAARVVRLAREGDRSSLPLALERYAVLCHGEGKMGQEADAWRELAELCPDRADVRQKLAGAYTRILDGDPGDEEAWRGLELADPGLASQLHVILMPVDP